MYVLARQCKHKKWHKRKKWQIVKSKQQIWMDGWTNVQNKWEFYLNVRRTIATWPLKDIMGNFYDRRKNNTRSTHKMHYHFSSGLFSFFLIETERMQQFYFPFVQLFQCSFMTNMLSCLSSILLRIALQRIYYRYGQRIIV